MSVNAKQTVEIFDPPMCCSTGICGPTVDQSLIDVGEMVLLLKARGISVERYQLNTRPQAFMANPAVLALVRERQLSALPITTVNGRIIKTGSYATAAEVEAALGT
ncbi:MAG: arsenite efflux transporter metallochaperone ArsD [Bacillota bacterium]|nr:arsenite efflux transporter metallochaperone ArsD [Bacillota bacterium]